ncbi:MAG: hypothetical protein Q9170_007024 [Blastenia crenularia]
MGRNTNGMRRRDRYVYLPVELTMIRPSIAFCVSLTFVLITFTHCVSAIACYPETPDLRPAIFVECNRIINLIPSVHQDPDSPLTFGEDPKDRADIDLPAYWRDSRDNCVVGLHMKSGEVGIDRLSLNGIKEAAKEVALA